MSRPVNSWGLLLSRRHCSTIEHEVERLAARLVALYAPLQPKEAKEAAQQLCARACELVPGLNLKQRLEWAKFFRERS